MYNCNKRARYLAYTVCGSLVCACGEHKHKLEKYGDNEPEKEVDDGYQSEGEIQAMRMFGI